MSFCPNCGKAVTEQASKCASCGHELEARAKAARFKGTMMMQAGTVPQPAPPAAEPKPAPAPAPTPAAAAAPPAATKPTGPSQSKVMKATMLGTGGPGLAAPPGGLRPSAAQAGAPAAAQAKPVAPPPAAGSGAAAKGSTANDLAFAETSLHPSMPGPIAESPKAQPAAAPAAQASGREDSQRFLAGDPMAPDGSPQTTGRRSARESLRAVLPVENTGKLIAIGIGGALVIVAIGYFAARLLGLMH